MAALAAHRAVSGAFSSWLAVCNTLASRPVQAGLAKASDAYFRWLCVSSGTGCGVQSFTKSGFHLTASQLVPPLPALPTFGGCCSGTCDDKYSTCWLSACQLQRTGGQPLPGSLPHSSGASHGQRSRRLIRGLPSETPPPRLARNPRAACDGPRGRKSPRPATTACARISETWTPNSS